MLLLNHRVLALVYVVSCYCLHFPNTSAVFGGETVTQNLVSSTNSPTRARNDRKTFVPELSLRVLLVLMRWLQGDSYRVRKSVVIFWCERYLLHNHVVWCDTLSMAAGLCVRDHYLMYIGMLVKVVLVQQCGS